MFEKKDSTVGDVSNPSWELETFEAAPLTEAVSSSSLILLSLEPNGRDAQDVEHISKALMI